MVFTSFAAALGQLGDRRFRRVVLWGVVLALLLLVGVYAVFLLAITAWTPDVLDVPLLGRIEGLHDLLGWASLGIMLLLSVFLMQPAALAFAGLFLDDVADAVEARHYAWLPPARPVPLRESITQSVNLLGLMLILNLVLLLATVPLGPLAIPAFFLANGFLLGREYFTSVASRRLPPEAMRALRRRHLWRIWIAGALMSVPLTVPLVNLLVPVLGTATFTHLFHKIAAADQR